MKYVWVAAAVAPLAFAASLAQAQTSVGGGSSTPLATSTAGDVTITSNGSITLPSASVAPIAGVTVNSSNTVSNAGVITSTGPTGTLGSSPGTSYVAGVVSNVPTAGYTGEILNSGTITVTETDTSSDANGDGVTDTENKVAGEYASGSNRYGILVNGPGTFTGVADTTNNSGVQTAIYSGGSITVIGENSAGVAVLTNINGDMLINGTIAVTGGNYNNTTNANSSDVSYGILTTGQVNGKVTLGGTVSAAGGNAVGVALLGGVTGAINVSATITSSGYRNTTPRTTYGLGTIATIEETPTEVMQGGPAMEVAGTVGGGLNISAAVVATSTVAAVAAGSLSTYGDAPALLVGSATTPTVIGPVSGDGHGIVIGGSVTGEGLYDNVNAVGAQIGGLGAAVTVNGGVSISGTLEASAYGSLANKTPINAGGGTDNGSAIGLRIGSGATVPIIDVSGTLSATSLTNQTSQATMVTALQFDAGATKASTVLTNTGVISAAIGATDILSNNVEIAQGGTAGVATAILDNAGAITTINNENTISATFTTANTTDVVTGTTNAIYLANTGPVTINQSSTVLTSTSGTTTTTTTTTPAITGDVSFGSGAGIINLNAGTLTGDTSFGNASSNYTSSAGDQINIAGAAGGTIDTVVMKGNVTVGTGGQLEISVNNGTLDITNDSGKITSTGLTIGSTGQLVLSADPGGSEPLLNGQLDVSGATMSIASGAKIGLNLLSALPGTSYSTVEHYTVILTNPADAAQLANFTLGQTPYLYHASLDTTYQPDALTIDITRATAAQLNLNANQTAAYNAIYSAFITDPAVEADILSKSTEATFKKAYDQFLPDFAGGPFESLAIGQQAVIREQETQPLKLETDQSRGWVQEIGFLTHQGDADSAGYNAGGFGVSAGMESAKGVGVVGVSGAFLTTEVADAGQNSYGHMAGSVLEAGVYWRSNTSAINANASLDGGYAWFGSQREILDTGPNPESTKNPDVPATTATLQRAATAQWGGGLIAGQVGLNAPIDFGRFYLRPEVSADYIALFEQGYAERGGGSAFDLTVAPRTSQQASAQVDLVLGATFGDAVKYRPELMIGWRGVVYGGPGATTAHFTSGTTDFTLNANFKDKGGLLARLGLRAGGPFADFTADAGGEFNNNFESYDARALARFLF